MRRKNKCSIREVHSGLKHLNISGDLHYYHDSEEWPNLLCFLGKKNTRNNRKSVWTLMNKKIPPNDEENIDVQKKVDSFVSKENETRRADKRRKRRPKRLSSSEFLIPKYFRSRREKTPEKEHLKGSSDYHSKVSSGTKETSVPKSGEKQDDNIEGDLSSTSSRELPETESDAEVNDSSTDTNLSPCQRAGDKYTNTDVTVSDLDNITKEQSNITTDEDDKSVSENNMRDVSDKESRNCMNETEYNSSTDADLSTHSTARIGRTKTFNYPDSFTFELSKEEYTGIAPQNRNESVNWRRLRGEWTDIFQEKFSTVVPCCVLVFVYNRVKKAGSRKLTSPFFQGRAECKYKDCSSYQFIIKEEPRSDEEIVQVMVSRQGDIIHEAGLKLKRHLKGTRRKKYAKRLEKIGVGNLHHKVLGEMPEEAVEAGNLTDCSTPTVLYKVLQEARQQSQSSNYREELLITQNIISRLDEDSSCIKGYIQSVGANPFNMFMFSEQQIQLLRDELKAGNDILYFDATGGVIKKQKDIHKDIYYYALILRNRCQNEPPIPVAEMVSADHTTPMIQFFLLKFRHAYKQVTRKLPLIRRVEIDFSWPLLYSVIHVFNHDSLSGYLSKCWDLLNDSTPSSPGKAIVVVHLCAWHMLRALGRSLESVTKDKAMKTFVKYCFGMLQNCTSLKEARQLYNEIYIVLNQNVLTKDVKKCLKSLRRRITNLPAKVVEGNETDSHGLLDFQIETDNQGPLKKISPFTKFFDVNVRLQNTTGRHEDQNSYFLPEAFHCIEKFMFLFPLWSGAMLKDEYSSTGAEITRDTQCHVENWFHIVKDSILQKERRIAPAEFALRLYENLRGRVRRFRLTRDEISLKKKHLKHRKKDRYGEEGMMKKEKWKKKRRKTSLFQSPSKLPEPRQKRKRTYESSTDDSISNIKKRHVTRKLGKKTRRDLSLSPTSSSDHISIEKSDSVGDEHNDKDQPVISLKKKNRPGKTKHTDRKKKELSLGCGIINKQ